MGKVLNTSTHIKAFFLKEHLKKIIQGNEDITYGKFEILDSVRNEIKELEEIIKKEKEFKNGK